MRKLIALTMLSLACFSCSEPKTNFQPHPEIVLDGAGYPVLNGHSYLALDLKDNLSIDQIEEMSKEYGIDIRDISPNSRELGNLEVADINGPITADLMRKLEGDPRVEIVEPEMLVEAYWEPNDPMYKDQYGMKITGATKAWSYSTGQNVVVSIIDTGVDETHPDLQGVKFLPGYNFAGGNTNTKDKQSHGTHVCSTVSEVINNSIGGIGLAPDVKILPVKALGDNGSGTMEGVAASINFAVKNGANIINMSLGSRQTSAIVAKAVKNAYDNGVFVAVAAGNDGTEMRGSPSNDFGSFAVSATDQNNNLASFSSYGKALKIAAPGVDIMQGTISRDGKGTHVYQKYSGTSMASPHMAAAGALLYSQGITNPDKALQYIQTTAIPKNNPTKYGAGILDAASATRSVWLNHTLYRGGLTLLFFTTLLYLFKRQSVVFNANTKSLAIGALLTSVGLLPFLPMTGLLPYLGQFRVVGEILSRPLADWDLLYSVNLHNWLPFATALPTFLMVSLGFHRPMLRSLAGGMALGTAAYMTQAVYSGEVNFVMGTFLFKVWAIVNVIACLWVAKNTMAKQ